MGLVSCWADSVFVGEFIPFFFSQFLASLKHLDIYTLAIRRALCLVFYRSNMLTFILTWHHFNTSLFYHGTFYLYHIQRIDLLYHIFSSHILGVKFTTPTTFHCTQCTLVSLCTDWLNMCNVYMCTTCQMHNFIGDVNFRMIF